MTSKVLLLATVDKDQEVRNVGCLFFRKMVDGSVFAVPNVGLTDPAPAPALPVTLNRLIMLMCLSVSS